MGDSTNQVPTSSEAAAPAAAIDTSAGAARPGAETIALPTAASASVTAGNAAPADVPGDDKQVASLEEMTIALRVLDGKEKLSALLTHLSQSNKPLHDAMTADAVDYLGKAGLLPKAPVPLALGIEATPLKAVAVKAAPVEPERDSVGQVKADPYIPGPRTAGKRIPT